LGAPDAVAFVVSLLPWAALLAIRKVRPTWLVRVAHAPRLGVIETARTRCRPARRSDAEALSATMDAEMLETNGWGPSELASDAKLVADPGRYPMVRKLVIEDRSTGEVLGAVTLTAADGGVQLGWHLGPRARRQGYGSEVVDAVCTAAFRAGVDVLSFGTAQDNVGVQRIAARIGAHEIARRTHTLPNGRQVTGIFYAIPAPTADEL
jgi:RimJ/RimL family protein N-acetyltransferase